MAPSLAGVAFGLYMSAHPKTRGPGRLFALWWVPGLVAAAGVFLRDPVTVVVGVFCFAVAGAAFVLEYGGGRRKPSRHEARTRTTPRGGIEGTDEASARPRTPRKNKWEKKRRRSSSKSVRRRGTDDRPGEVAS